MASLRLQAFNIEKRYGPVRALKKVSLEMARGELWALLGEHGSGKSTLGRLLAGEESPDGPSARILIDGRPYAQRPLGILRTPKNRLRKAIQAGIFRIGTLESSDSLHPQCRLVEGLSVEENLFLGQEAPRVSRWGWVYSKTLRNQARRVLDSLECGDIHPATAAGLLSAADQLRVELVRAFLMGARVLILDEPTRFLSDTETARCWKIVRKLATSGVSVLWIGQNLETAFQLCHRYLILHEGEAVATGELACTDRKTLRRILAGPERNESPVLGNRKLWRKKEVLKLEGLAPQASGSSPPLILHEGEILGLAGLSGEERKKWRERAETALLQATSKNGKNGSLPLEIALLTAHRDNLFEPMDIADNLTLPVLSHLGWGGFFSVERQWSLAWEWMTRMHLVASSPGQPMRNLPEGARQKVRLGRVLMQRKTVLWLEEPTWGIDPSSRREMELLIRTAAAEGRSIFWVDSDPAELLRLCDTVALWRNGQLEEIRPVEEWTEAELSAALWGAPKASPPSFQNS